MTRYEYLMNCYTAAEEKAAEMKKSGDTAGWRAMMNCANGFQMKIDKLTVEEAGEEVA